MGVEAVEDGVLLHPVLVTYWGSSPGVLLNDAFRSVSCMCICLRSIDAAQDAKTSYGKLLDGLDELGITA